jgi:hypothetical protein
MDRPSILSPTDSPWHNVYMLWIDAGCPDDIPAPELAMIRLQAVVERDGWRERERATHAAELLVAAERLVSMLTMLGCVVTLGDDGKPRIRGDRQLWTVYLPELTALREPITRLLAR